MGVRRPWNQRQGFAHGDDERTFLPSRLLTNRSPVGCRQRTPAGPDFKRNEIQLQYFLFCP